jgi:hypothetical protein
MTIQEIRDYINEHKDDEEVSTFIGEFNQPKEIGTDDVLEFLKKDEGRQLVQPFIDQAVTKAVKTRDKAHEIAMESELKKRVASEVLKLNPQEEPWQKEIRELKEANELEKRERAKDQLKRQLVEKAAAINVNPFFIEDYLPESIEQGELYLKKIKEYGESIEKKAINDALASGTMKPKSGSSKDTIKKDLSKLSDKELRQLEEEGKLDDLITA